MTRDETVPGPHGPVPVRVYSPAGDAGRACPAWSGCTGRVPGGDLDMPEADWTAREICERAGAVVVSVDYRLCGRRRDLSGAARRHRGGRPLGARQRRGPRHRRRPHLARRRQRRRQPGHRRRAAAARPGRLGAGGPAARLRDRARRRPAAVTGAGRRCSPRSRALLVPPRGPPRRSPSTTWAGRESADGYAMPGNAVLEGLCPSCSSTPSTTTCAPRPRRSPPRSRRPASTSGRCGARDAARLPEPARRLEPVGRAST